MTTAVDGLDGLEKFRHGHFHLILTNLSTARISGWELGRIVKNSYTFECQWHLLPAWILVPARSTPPSMQSIPEPFQSDEFQCLVDSLLECKEWRDVGRSRDTDQMVRNPAQRSS